MNEMVPDGWSVIDLEDGIKKLVSGQSPNRKENAAGSDTYGILKTTAIDWGKFDETKNQEVLDEFSPNMNHLVVTGDVLITKAGPANRVGVVALAKDVSGKVLLSGKMTAVRVNQLLQSDFLAYALCQETAQNHLKSNITGMALSQTNFTHSSLLRVPILLPPLPEQKKIASILTSVDDVIENTQRQIDKLQDLKKATMNELLTKGIGHTEFKDSELGRIPKGWEVVELKELCEKIGDGLHSTPVYSPSNSYYFINGNNLKNGNIIIDEKTKSVCKLEYDKYFIEMTERTVLLSINGTIGNVALYQGEQVILGKSAAYLSASNRISRRFLFYILQTLRAQKYFYDELTGTTIKNLSLKTIRSTLCPVPPPFEQDKITSIVDSMDCQIVHQKQKLAQTQSLKKSLMQDLLMGKMRVKVN